MEIASRLDLDLIKTVMNVQQSLMEEKLVSESEELPPWFMPSEHDVICGWARQNYHHGKSLVARLFRAIYVPCISSRSSTFLLNDPAGNRRLRDIIDENIELYDGAKNRADKGRVIIEIVERLRQESPTGIGLVKYDRGSRLWSYIGKEKAKDKIGHALRKASQDKQKLLEEDGPILQSHSAPPVANKKKKQARQKKESGHAPGFSFIGDSSPLEEATFEFPDTSELKPTAVSQHFSKDPVSQHSNDLSSSKRKQECAYPYSDLPSWVLSQEVTSLGQLDLQSSSSQQQLDSMPNSNLIRVQEALQLQQQGTNAPSLLSGSQMGLSHIDLSTNSSITAPLQLLLPSVPWHHHQLQEVAVTSSQSDMRMGSEQQQDVSAQFPCFIVHSHSTQLHSGNQQSSMSLPRRSDQLVRQQQDNNTRSSPAPHFLQQQAGAASTSGVLANHVLNGEQPSNTDIASSSQGNIPFFVPGVPACDTSQEWRLDEILRTMVSTQQQQQDLHRNNLHHF
jgi:hypothetical protein